MITGMAHQTGVRRPYTVFAGMGVRGYALMRSKGVEWRLRPSEAILRVNKKGVGTMCRKFEEKGLKPVTVKARYFDGGERTNVIATRDGADGTLRVGRKAYNAAARRVRLALSDVLETEDGRLVYAVA